MNTESMEGLQQVIEAPRSITVSEERDLFRTVAKLVLVVGDFFIFLASFTLAFIATHHPFNFEDVSWFAGFDWNPDPSTGMAFVWKGMPFPMWDDFYAYMMGILIPLPIIRHMVMQRLQLYRLDGEISMVEDAIETFRGITIGTILLIVIAFSLGGGRGEHELVGNRRIFPYDWLMCTMGCTALRMGVRTAQRGVRRKGRNLTPVILVGRGKDAEMLKEELARDLVLGYRVVHTIEAEGTDPDIEQRLNDLPKRLQETGAREVIFATKKITQKELFPVVMSCGSGVRFKALPDLMGLRPKKVAISRLKYLPLLEIFVDPIRGANGTMKRILDLSVATVALIIFAIPIAIIALLIKLDSKGPIIFKQTRMGLDFRPFPFYKFRSMRTDIDHSRHEEFMKKVIQEGSGTVDDDSGKVVFKEKDDPRITRVGRLIRKYSLDELPQIFNVVRGEMSIVGPRPPVPYEVTMYREHHMPRLSVKPGITGVWQVSGRNAVSFEEMVKMDVTYMENWSLLTDIKIILRTIPVVLFPRDAY